MSEQRTNKNKYIDFTYSINQENGAVIESVDIPVGYAYGDAQQIFEQF